MHHPRCTGSHPSKLFTEPPDRGRYPDTICPGASRCGYFPPVAVPSRIAIFRITLPVSNMDEAELLHQLQRLACYELTHELLVESQIGPVVGTRKGFWCTQLQYT
eukprot:517778-Pelagomonas_calceolata.AAC.2